jgi:hypothetical protein
MTPRDKITAVIKGEILSEIPVYREGPMDVTVLEGLIKDPEESAENMIDYTKFFKSCVTYLGIDMESKTLSKDKNHHLYTYETGAIWRESYNPTFCREAEKYPVNIPSDALSFRFSDAGFKERFDSRAIREKIKAWHDAGFFVEGQVMGAFHGIYYYVTSFENILMWMAVEKEAAAALFNETARYSMESAYRLLDCGVDAIVACSDLGTARSLIFSKDMFREFMYPWLKELCGLCHRRGRFMHLHSHGHIGELMDDFIECGVDVINPIGPSDNNDLSLFKEKWGDRITLNAGISTTIMQMTDEEMKNHIFQVVGTGRVGGRFFPRTESGIPPMSREKTIRYLEYLGEACQMGFSRK